MSADQVAPRESTPASHGAEEVAEIIARLGFFVSHGVRAGSPPLGLLERACTALARLVRERDEWIDEVARFNRGFDRRAEPYEALDDEFEQMGYVWANFDQLRADLATARERIADTSERVEEMEALFDLRLKADQRAVKMWRAEKPDERELSWPDHADMCVWLLARLDSARAILEEAREFIYVHPSPRASLTEQCAMLDRIDSWLASGGKTT